MTIQSAEKKHALIAELGETDIDGLTKTLEVLDNYTVTPPSAEATDHLLKILTSELPEQPVQKNFTAEKNTPFFIFARLQLVLSQTRLFSCSFIALSILLLLCGMGLTTMLNGDTVRFLTNAAPLLGILTVLYQFRSNYNHMNELEDARPYTPAQLAAARLLLVLVYDTSLCLVATFLVSYNHYELWQLIAHWLAPLFLTLGIALFSSLHFGIWGGCLLSTAVWGVNLAASKDGKSIFSVLAPYLDIIGTAIGLILLTLSYRRLSRAGMEL